LGLPHDLATIEIIKAGSTTVVRVVGELDLSNAPTLRAELWRTIQANSSASSVVVDLAEVTFLGVAGLAVLAEGSRLAGESGTTVLLARPSKPVRRLIEITGLEAVLTVQEEN
jgi:anti-anti-sigma factor